MSSANFGRAIFSCKYFDNLFIIQVKMNATLNITSALKVYIDKKLSSSHTSTIRYFVIETQTYPNSQSYILFLY